jgi:SAM-dependent methyltransferase
VDFNKSCREQLGELLPPSGILVHYYLCGQCGFCFAPEFTKWQLSEFETRIYNDKYTELDPDYLSVRPQTNANKLISFFKDKKDSIRHLDYGGGNGLLSNILRKAGWQSSSYDPFVDRETNIRTLGVFNLITAYEVFEHVPDVIKLIEELKLLLAEDGIVHFTTMLSDGHVKPNERLNWWYAAPRNGHISLFSYHSLNLLLESNGLNLGSFTPGVYVLFKQVPQWAEALMKHCR